MGTKISELPTSGTLVGTELIEVVQTGVSRKTTITAILTDLSIPQYDPMTGELEVNNVVISGITEYTWAQFLTLDPNNYHRRTILINDVNAPHALGGGVKVTGDSTGAGSWTWDQTPSLNTAQVPPALQASGWRIYIKDISSYWYSDGTRYKLDQDSLVISKIISNVALTGMPVTATVAKQTPLPRIDGKCCWGDGDILEIHQIANKVGVADTIYNSVHVGITPRTVNQDELGANTLIDQYGSDGNARTNAINWRMQRVSPTSIKYVGVNGMPALGGTSGGAAMANITVPNLDTSQSYVDATIRVLTSTGDSSLALIGYSLRLISSGAS